MRFFGTLELPFFALELVVLLVFLELLGGVLLPSDDLALSTNHWPACVPQIVFSDTSTTDTKDIGLGSWDDTISLKNRDLYGAPIGRSFVPRTSDVSPSCTLLNGRGLIGANTRAGDKSKQRRTKERTSSHSRHTHFAPRSFSRRFVVSICRIGVCRSAAPGAAKQSRAAATTRGRDAFRLSSAEDVQSSALPAARRDQFLGPVFAKKSIESHRARGSRLHHLDMAIDAIER